MTVADLIINVLGAIRGQWYADRVGEFHRDKQALTKAIARYGHECASRGWDFEPRFVQRELLDVLNEIKRTGAEIKYLPAYLEGAVDKHVRQRADELSAAAKTVGPRAAKILRGAERVAAVVEQKPVEALALLYQDLRRRQRQARAARGARRNEKEGVLL